jgi:transcriptional regulator with XRE-family HTH domain
MGLTGPNFDSVDNNLAANLRLRREAAGLSQEELAARMTERGFGFTQATIWKIEQGKRPVKLSEAVALGDALGMLRWASLLDHPDKGRHEANLEGGHRKAAAAYRALADAARDYIWAQLELGVSVFEAREADLGVHELWTTYLDIPAEKAVLEARIAGELDEQHGMEIAEELAKVVASLREHGYTPIVNPDNVVRSDADTPDPATEDPST